MTIVGHFRGGPLDSSERVLTDDAPERLVVVLDVVEVVDAPHVVGAGRPWKPTRAVYRRRPRPFVVEQRHEDGWDASHFYFDHDPT